MATIMASGPGMKARHGMALLGRSIAFRKTIAGGQAQQAADETAIRIKNILWQGASGGATEQCVSQRTAIVYGGGEE